MNELKPVQRRRGVGEPCIYCERLMEDRLSRSWLAVTRDHHIPRSKGGRKIVLACRACNSIKGDMLPADWDSFMASFPQWWETPERFISITARRRSPTVAKLISAGAKALSVRPSIALPFVAPKHRPTKHETQRAFAEWQSKARRERKQAAAHVPYEESMMVLRHGKDYWKAWKERGEPICECCRRGRWIDDLVAWSQKNSCGVGTFFHAPNEPG